MTQLPVTLEGQHATLRLSRPAPSVLLVEINGHDAGEHGEQPLRLLQEALQSGPAYLFVDARHTRAASTEVSHQWAQWLSAHRGRLLGLHMLPGSWFVQLTLEFVRRYARLDGLMHVHGSPTDFEVALRQASNP